MVVYLIKAFTSFNNCTDWMVSPALKPGMARQYTGNGIP